MGQVLRETGHSEPFQDTSRPESSCDPSDISYLETHTPTTRSRGISVMSSLADFDLQAALAESQRRITELKDIVVKKFGDEKPDDPRLGFCDFLKVEVVQLTSDSYDEFQQETFNLLMRLEQAAAKVPTRDGHKHDADRHLQPSLDVTPLPSVSHTDAGTTATDVTDFYTCNARAVTSAATAFRAAATAFTAAISRHSLSRMDQLSSRSTDTLHSTVCSHSNTCT